MSGFTNESTSDALLELLITTRRFTTRRKSIRARAERAGSYLYGAGKRSVCGVFSHDCYVGARFSVRLIPNTLYDRDARKTTICDTEVSI